MQDLDNLKTIIIGRRSNLSDNLSKRFIHSEVFSSDALLKSLFQLSKFKEKRINIIFNNFQPSTALNSFVDPCKYLDLSISLTIRVLVYLIESGTEINKIIYTSSCSVYGDLERLNNYSMVSPTGIPSSLKYLNEQFLKEVCSNNGIDFTIARIFNMFGGNDSFSVISKIINCYKDGSNLNLINNGIAVRDFIHVNNIVDTYECLLDNSSIKFDTIDIGTGKAKSLADILAYLSDNGYFINTKNVSSNQIDFSQADTSRIQEVIDISSFIDVNSFLLDNLQKA